jgi:hypothetical protein
VAVVVLCFAMYCGPALSKLSDLQTLQEKLVSDAKAKIPSLAEFSKLYPDARPRVYTKYFRDGSSSVQSTTIIHDLYELTLTVDFEFDRKLEIKSPESPSILLLEIVSVEEGTRGQLHISYGANYRITESQWRKVVESGGDFLAAGIPIKTNQPAPGIEKEKRRLSRPPI